MSNLTMTKGDDYKPGEGELPADADFNEYGIHVIDRDNPKWRDNTHSQQIVVYDESPALRDKIILAYNIYEELLTALQPFAAMAKSYDDMTNTPEEIEFTILDRDGAHRSVKITRENFVAARDVLNKAKEGR